MATGPSLIESAISQVKSSPTIEAEDTTESSSDFLTSSESTETGYGGEPIGTESEESGDTSEGSSKDAAAAETDSSSDKAPASKTPNKEVITISDDKGRRKVEIDFNNRDQIRKYVQMAHGARKWQAERDAAQQSAKQLQEQYAEKDKTLSALEQAYENGGEAGVLDLLAGRQGAHKEFAQNVIARERLQKDDPEAYKALMNEERIARMERELEKERSARAKDKESISKEREKAEEAALESNVHPAFEKYRFDGKLGNADDEQMFDEMLWNAALKRLEPYEEKGQLSRQIIDREFNTVATSLRKRMGVQVEKKVAKVVEQKKQEATENAQAATMSAYKTGGVRKEAADLINSGNLAGLFKGWKKYGKVFK